MGYLVLGERRLVAPSVVLASSQPLASHSFLSDIGFIAVIRRNTASNLSAFTVMSWGSFFTNRAFLQGGFQKYFRRFLGRDGLLPQSR